MGGTWVMNDETLPEYKNMLLQQQTGLKWLNQTFGVHPRVAWQIDPFGNSAVTPALFSQLGFEAIILSRVGTTVYAEMEKTKAAEFIWSGVSSKPDESNLFAHALELSRYQNPVEFRYRPDPVMPWDHPRVICDTDHIEERYELCMQVYWEEVIEPSLKGTQHSKVFSIWGDDFAFSSAQYSYDYISKLFEVFK